MELIKLLEIAGIMTPGEIELKVIDEDPTDNKFIAAAIEGEAEYVISGDEHLRKLGEFKGVKILSPGEFIKVMGVSEVGDEGSNQTDSR